MMGIIVPILAALAGFPLHQVFMRNELDTYPLPIIGITMSSIVLLAQAFHIAGLETTYRTALLASFQAIAIAITSMFINMLTYRAFFHPLKNFPGRFGARLSKFWALGKVVQSRVRWYQVAEELHAQYGDYVRVGPREISIADPDALLPVLGPSSKLRKGPFYGSVELNLHCHRDAAFHRPQRKIWDMAFKESLADYGPSVEEFTSHFLSRIEESAGIAVHVNKLCLNYSYDVMSLLAFGEASGFLAGNETAQSRRVLKALDDTLLAVGGLIHVPWIITMVESMTFGGPMADFYRWSEEALAKRRKAKVSSPDIIGHLIEHSRDDEAGRKMLEAECRLIIVAGSDTGSATLTLLFIHLALYPHYQDLLLAEVDRSFTAGTYSCGAPQPILDGIINEVLRIYNPSMFSPQRVTGPEGLQIGSVYIPPDTVVSLNRRQLQIDPRNFVHPTEFIPERWSTRPELIINRAAFVPFSLGKYNCPGKNVTLMELRSVIARTVSKYRISLPEGAPFNAEAFFGNIKEHFTIGVQKLELVFEARKDVKV